MSIVLDEKTSAFVSRLAKYGCGDEPHLQSAVIVLCSSHESYWHEVLSNENTMPNEYVSM